jgi:hypothetical protein
MTVIECVRCGRKEDMSKAKQTRAPVGVDVKILCQGCKGDSFRIYTKTEAPLMVPPVAPPKIDPVKMGLLQRPEPKPLVPRKLP